MHFPSLMLYSFCMGTELRSAETSAHRKRLISPQHRQGQLIFSAINSQCQQIFSFTVHTWNIRAHLFVWGLDIGWSTSPVAQTTRISLTPQQTWHNSQDLLRRHHTCEDHCTRKVQKSHTAMQNYSKSINIYCRPGWKGKLTTVGDRCHWRPDTQRHTMYDSSSVLRMRKQEVWRARTNECQRHNSGWNREHIWIHQINGPPGHTGMRTEGNDMAEGKCRPLAVSANDWYQQVWWQQEAAETCFQTKTGQNNELVHDHGARYTPGHGKSYSSIYVIARMKCFLPRIIKYAVKRKKIWKIQPSKAPRPPTLSCSSAFLRVARDPECIEIWIHNVFNDYFSSSKYFFLKRCFWVQLSHGATDV